MVLAAIPVLPAVRTVQFSTTVESPVFNRMPESRQPETETCETSTFIGALPE
jgi:hypothetical protein